MTRALAMLTSEQLAVVEHPQGAHARAIAGPGTGKTFVAAVRAAKHIAIDGVSPKAVRIVQFNRLAREQFTARIKTLLPPRQRPHVDTFHSAAHAVLKAAKEMALLPPETQLWANGAEERVRTLISRSIAQVERQTRQRVDPERAERFIALAKAWGLTPERAGHHGREPLGDVYDAYEGLRAKQNVLTFDDYLPEAVSLLERSTELRALFADGVAHVFVDEAQDMSFTQLRFVALLAGGGADVMAIGDGHQQVNEWRGARQEHFAAELRHQLPAKPWRDYALTRSFRFGAAIAQVASNLISDEIASPSITVADAGRASVVRVVDGDGDAQWAEKVLVDEINALVRAGVLPREIRVLGRTYAQTERAQIEMLERHVPFKVDGHSPLFSRPEVRALCAYVTAARALDGTITDDVASAVELVANKPLRYLPGAAVARAVSRAVDAGRTLRDALDLLAHAPDTPLSVAQSVRVVELAELLARARELVATFSAGDLFAWLVDAIDLRGYLQDFHGSGEPSADRIAAVDTFLGYARRQDVDAPTFVERLRDLDTTCGGADDELIVVSSIHRTKGREWDVVIIPSMIDGFMPCANAGDDEVFDIDGVIEIPPASSPEDAERRLGYVALTRARRMLLIGTGGASRGSPCTSFVARAEARAVVDVFGADSDAAVSAAARKHSTEQKTLLGAADLALSRGRSMLAEDLRGLVAVGERGEKSRGRRAPDGGELRPAMRAWSAAR